MFDAEVQPMSRMQRCSSESSRRESSISPLERRVSLGDAWVERVSGLEPDGPRKSFMRFCVTAGITVASLQESMPYRKDGKGAQTRFENSPLIRLAARNRGCLHFGALLTRLPCFRCLRLHIDLPLEVCAFLDGDALRGDVANRNRRLAQLHPLGGVDIAFHLALYRHALGIQLGAHLAVGANDQSVGRQFDGAFHHSIH